MLQLHFCKTINLRQISSTQRGHSVSQYFVQFCSTKVAFLTPKDRSFIEYSKHPESLSEFSGPGTADIKVELLVVLVELPVSR